MPQEYSCRSDAVFRGLLPPDVFPSRERRGLLVLQIRGEASTRRQATKEGCQDQLHQIHHENDDCSWVRSTTSLGAHTDADIVSRYQIHFRILNAVHYGSPQRRRRIVFLASRQGYPLPAFPIPTHTAIKDAHKYSLPTGDYVYPIVRHRPHSNLTDKTVHYQMAPCQGVTVENAISDLVHSIFILFSC